MKEVRLKKFLNQIMYDVKHLLPSDLDQNAVEHITGNSERVEIFKEFLEEFKNFDYGFLKCYKENIEIYLGMDENDQKRFLKFMLLSLSILLSNQIVVVDDE